MAKTDAKYRRLISDLEGLIISEGRHAGQKMKVLPWQRKFCRGVLDSPLAALSVARGNGKSTLAAGICCSALIPDGALFQPRGEIVLIASSLGQARIAFRHVYYFLRARMEKSGKDWRVIDNSQQSQIEYRPTGTVLKCLGSDSRRAHGLAPTVILADEPAKWVGGGREMFAALKTSMGKQMNARFVAIGTRPDTQDHWFSELLEDNSTGWHRNYQAFKGDPDFAAATISKANPSLSHMPDLRATLKLEAKEARIGGYALSQWRALRLNMGTPEVGDREMLISLENWTAVVTADPAAKSDGVFVGVDLGGGTSMSAVAFYWPSTGRLECFGAFSAEPGLHERGKLDYVGERYLRMSARGELRIYPGTATNNILFLEEMFHRIGGMDVLGISADRYKQNDLKQAMTALGMDAGIVDWRVVGRGPDGSEDVKAFQREVLEGHLNCAPTLAIDSAIAEAVLHRDVNGNPALNKARHKSRIDVIQAAVLAVGAGRRWRIPPERARDYQLENFVV